MFLREAFAFLAWYLKKLSHSQKMLYFHLINRDRSALIGNHDDLNMKFNDLDPLRCDAFILKQSSCRAFDFQRSRSVPERKFHANK